MPDVHGIVCKGLKDFVVETHGKDAWAAIHDEAGLRMQIYVPVREYPDEVVLELVEAASQLTGTEVETLLYEFGRFVVPSLVQVYGIHVDQEWTGLDLIANVEVYIHEALRANRFATFTPPKIASKQIGENRVVVAYGSERELCPLAEGLLVGVGEHYDETLTVEEYRCVHEGEPRCEFLVTRGPSSDGAKLGVAETAASDHGNRLKQRNPSNSPNEDRDRDEVPQAIDR